MPLTRNALVGYAEQAVGGRFDARIDAVDLVNDAGRTLVAMHPWKFLQRPPVNLTTTAGQNYIELPADFSEIVALEVSDNYALSIRAVTMGRMVLYEGTAGAAGMDLYVSPEFPNQPSTSEPAPQARLHLYDSPAASSEVVAILAYRAGWTPLTTGKAVPNVPEDVGPLLTQVVQHFARGFVMQQASGGQVTPVSEVEKLRGSAMFQAILQKYGATQSEAGEMRNGITPFRYHRRRTTWLHDTITVT